MLRRFTYLLLGIVPWVTGCLHFVHPTTPIRIEDWRPSDDLLPESKNCIYVFILNGHDPLGYCNLEGVKHFLHDIGFGKTYYGQIAHLSYFAGKMRELHLHCPESRFVIIGFDHGAATAQDLAVEAKKSHIPVDLLVYLEPQGTVPIAEPLATQTMTVHGNGPLFGYTDVIGVGDELLLENVHKSAVPTHPETLAMLERELTLIAMGVAFPPQIAEPPVPLMEQLPAPRLKDARPQAIPATWRMPTSYWGQMPIRTAETLPPPRVIPDLPGTISK